MVSARSKREQLDTSTKLQLTKTVTSISRSSMSRVFSCMLPQYVKVRPYRVPQQVVATMLRVGAVFFKNDLPNAHPAPTLSCSDCNQPTQHCTPCTRLRRRTSHRACAISQLHIRELSFSRLAEERDSFVPGMPDKLRHQGMNLLPLSLMRAKAQ